MNIGGTQFTLKTNSFEIYVSGCKGPHCKDCHNPELWDFSIGHDFEYIKQDIEKKIKRFKTLIKNIMIFGGDLNDQNREEAIAFLDFLLKFKKKIWLFTRYEITDIDINILNKCNFIKTGRYLKELTCDKNEWFGINLATSNQRIFTREEALEWILAQHLKNI